MDIAYSKSSRFLNDCEHSLRANRESLDNGNVVTIKLDDGGYNGRVHVTIRVDSGSSFDSDWDGVDPSRFPARIKAAATALFNCGYVGQFVIEHRNGRLKIQSV